MVPPLDTMTSLVKVLWPDGHTCIIGSWVGKYGECPCVVVNDPLPHEVG